MERAEKNRSISLIEAIRGAVGPDVEILLDLNFNAKTEGYLAILRSLADFDLFWVEIDSFSATPRPRCISANAAAITGSALPRSNSSRR